MTHLHRKDVSLLGCSAGVCQVCCWDCVSRWIVLTEIYSSSARLYNLTWLSSCHRLWILSPRTFVYAPGELGLPCYDCTWSVQVVFYCWFDSTCSASSWHRNSWNESLARMSVRQCSSGPRESTRILSQCLRYSACSCFLEPTPPKLPAVVGQLSYSSLSLLGTWQLDYL